MSEALPPEFAGFFEHVAAGRLAFPRCEGCQKFHWYPMPRCPHCQANRIIWQPVSGRAEIFSFTSVLHAFDKSRREDLPYIVALVVFADAPGVRLISNIVGTDYGVLHIGDTVEPVFAAAADRPLVNFRLAKSAPGERS